MNTFDWDLKNDMLLRKIDALEQRLREEEQRREEAIESWQAWEERALAAEAEVENLKGDLEATDAALAQERADFDYVVRRAEAAEVRVHELELEMTNGDLAAYQAACARAEAAEAALAEYNRKLGEPDEA